MKRKITILLILAVLIFAAAVIPAFAEETISSEANLATAENGAENFFTTVYEYALSYSSEIFSFLSLIGTVIISVLYKKGLLPSLKGALSSLLGTVGKMKEAGDKQCEEQKQTSKLIEEKLCRFETALDSYGKELAELRLHLISEEEMRSQRLKADKILSSQIDMMYDIFMTSSIPHYQKEATGERINKMRKELGDYE